MGENCEIDLSSLKMQNKDEACEICKPWSTDNLFHEHFSSKFLYKNTTEEIITCITCNLEHKKDLGLSRELVIMTTDLLHTHFIDKTVKSSIHLNLEDITGGKLRLVKNNWRHLYGNEKTPMDVIVIAGIYDLPYLSRNEYLEEI